MRISVKVKPNAKIEKIEKISQNNFNIWVKSPAKEGKANETVLRALAKHLKIAPSLIRIVFGKKSKNKIFYVSI